MATFNWLSWR